jgi:hypothetical protein
MVFDEKEFLVDFNNDSFLIARCVTNAFKEYCSKEIEKCGRKGTFDYFLSRVNLMGCWKPFHVPRRASYSSQ